MGRNSEKIKNIGRFYSVDKIKDHFSKLKYKPTTREEYERQRYFESQRDINNNSKHDSAINRIYENPSLIGIDDEFFGAEVEVEFFKRDLKKGAVDVLIETKETYMQ